VPVALNCCDVPRGILAVTGLTAMDISTGAVTVKVVAPEIAPEVAVIVVVPWLMVAANPVAFTLATVGELEVHVAEVVSVCEVPSL
jgi:hypothetical protein